MEQQPAMLPAAYLHLPELLSADMLSVAEQLISELEFADGKSTATGAAREVKQNMQALKGSDKLQQLQELIGNALSANPFFQAAALPQQMVPPVISKYEPGMSYGWHTDSPVMMGQGYPLRVDLSMTLFLSDPSTYDGGELIIHTASGYSTFKLNKGDAILYPTTRLHAVTEVTRGTRLAAVTWIQSMVKEADKRELLFQLKYVQERMALQNLHSMENLLLMQVHSNLMRMWAEV